MNKSFNVLLGGVLLVVGNHLHAQVTTTYYACVSNNGAVTMVTADTVCKGNSTKIQWNQVGPVGPSGPTGPQGPAGPGVETGSIIGRVIGCQASPRALTFIQIPGRSSIARPAGGGQFELKYLPAGTYDVQIEIDAHPLKVVPGVVVASGQVTDVGDQDICATDLCIPGQTKLCAMQQGVCSGSIMQCPSSGFWAPDCDYTTIPFYSVVDSCDNRDNNCNGSVDEDYPLKNTICRALVNGVCTTGTWVCSPLGNQLVCTAGSTPCP